MAANEKYKLLGFDPVHNKANVMVMNTGRVMSVSCNYLSASEVMEDLAPMEIAAIYRKIYSSGEAAKTQYDFTDRNENQWLVYAAFCLIISVCYVFSNVAAVKPVYIEYFKLIITPGTFVYPLTFLIVDLLNEFYGFRLARRAIYMCVFANSAILGLLTLSLMLPAIPVWEFNEAYSHLIHQLQATFIASTASFLTSELANSYVLCKIKRITNSRYLYIRIISSIFVASIIDSFVFCFIAFYSIMSHEQIIGMACIQIVIKLGYALVNVFPAYGARYLFNKYLVQKE
ncbi:queuosine precursor transporter [Candidatus Sodalis sp. SoCistrobi]|uniref:queuosine precursor transporter n=1 Tax=Candidatus Sodalis sp. SoCistrobi TaxID=1922216 RepID=UPI00093B9266|nr:queuosine precursor transporter [Candidatus Sodalis sp. SoCistrobi]